MAAAAGFGAGIQLGWIFRSLGPQLVWEAVFVSGGARCDIRLLSLAS